MSKEQRFYNALKDIFIGAKVEGESGYINLMKIKARYYEKDVFPKLQKDIEDALKPFPGFREELFDKLYTFFHRYFSESGSIYFRYTQIHQNVYEKVYTNDKDVMLFWKTHMLYYVKTDRLFKNLETEIDGIKFLFDVFTLQHKKAFEKREIIYEFKEIRKDKTIVFNVIYSERGRKTKIVEILRALKKEEVKVTEDVLEKAFRVFEKQSEVDYFINKNAKEFLKEQFNIWIYQYVFSGESEWTDKRISQLQALKDIAFKIIDFISQFEDELVKIWNKPKFVLNSNYVITLDRIAEKDNGLVEKIINHSNFDKQVKEWQDLGIINGSLNKSKVLENTLAGMQLKKKYKYLPIDTKYFKDLEFEILSLFGNLDNCLDGWLIKSENYQALNTILPKFKEKVQTIYIDPPFNKEQDADYFYSVKYKDASWITLLENRLSLAKDILNPKGSIFVRCDYNGNMFVRMLMDETFGENNFRNEIIANRSKYTKTAPRKFLDKIDSLFFYTKTEDYKYRNLRKKLPTEEQVWRPFLHLPGESKAIKYRIVEGKKFYPPTGRHWAFSQENLDIAYKKGLVRINSETKEPEIKTIDSEITNNWTDIPGYTARPGGFKTENSEILLKRVIESTSNDGDFIIDFFLGSGTTAAVAHKLKRKWIGVEVGEHFYSVVLPRMKKVLAYDKSGISKEKDVKEKYNSQNAGGFFKYYELEQYEDTLKKAKYEDSDLFDNPYQDPYNQYIFMKDLKMLEALELDYKKNKVKVDLFKLYQNIDIPETLSNLLGKWIKKINHDEVEFEDREKVNIKDLNYRLIKPLIWW